MSDEQLKAIIGEYPEVFRRRVARGVLLGIALLYLGLLSLGAFFGALATLATAEGQQKLGAAALLVLAWFLGYLAFAVFVRLREAFWPKRFHTLLPPIGALVQLRDRGDLDEFATEDPTIDFSTYDLPQLINCYENVDRERLPQNYAAVCHCIHVRLGEIFAKLKEGGQWSQEPSG